MYAGKQTKEERRPQRCLASKAALSKRITLATPSTKGPVLEKKKKNNTSGKAEKPITAEAEKAATQVSFHALTIMMIKQLPENHAAINEKAEGDPNSYADKSDATERHLVKSLA